MYATCCDCGAAFWRDEDQAWKRRCLSCWKASKAAKENARHEDRAANENTHANYSRACGSGEALVPLDKAHLRELLQLCHPDKHNGSDLAVRVTAWLLDLKREVRV